MYTKRKFVNIFSSWNLNIIRDAAIEPYRFSCYSKSIRVSNECCGIKGIAICTLIFYRTVEGQMEQK